jgi:hypothetical protein
MSSCDHWTVATAKAVHIFKEPHRMKKFMSIMLGLTLVVGAATVVSAQDKKEDKKEDGKKKKGKKKKTEVR